MGATKTVAGVEALVVNVLDYENGELVEDTEDFDPIDDVTESKWHCPDLGLVKEAFAEGGTLELIDYEPA